MRRAFKYGLIALILTGLTVSISIGFNLSFNFGSYSSTSTSTTQIYDYRDRPDFQQPDRSRTRIEIVKSRFQLSLFEGDRLLHTYPCVLGGDPVSDKRMEGDLATPEGIFHVNEVRVHDKWTRFIGIDYPTEDSWDRFNRRQQAGEIPVNATIGGEIGIHGVQGAHDEWIAEHNNWTLGCISLRTEDIISLANSVQIGTEVRIFH
jgi:murein L,D-transpeptidase YafK